MIWKFTLTDYTTNPSGDSTVVDEPNGWEAITCKLTRDMQTHGIFFDFTGNSLQFYNEAANILMLAYAANGVESKVMMTVDVQCDDDSVFQQFYYGKIVFSTYKEDCSDECSVTVTVEQMEAQMIFKNRMSSPVNLGGNKDFDNNTLPTYPALPFSLTLNAKSILQTSKRYTSTLIEMTPQQQTITHAVARGVGLSGSKNNDSYICFSLDEYSLDEINSYTAVLGGGGSFSDLTPYFILSEYGTYQIDLNLQVEIRAGAKCDADVLGALGGGGGGYNNLVVDAYLRVGSGADVLLGSWSVSSGSTIVAPIDYQSGNYYGSVGVFAQSVGGNLVYTGTFSGNVGDNVFIYFKINQDGQYHMDLLSKHDIQWNQGLRIYNPSYCNISALTTFPDSSTYAFAINESLSRIAEAVTDGEICVKSDYFGRTDSLPYASSQDGPGGLEVITKGLLIRGIALGRNSNAIPIFTQTFNDIFAALNSIHCIGIGFEPDPNRVGKLWLRVEPLSYFYNNTVILTCLNIMNVQRQVMSDQVYNTFKFGYNKYEAEQDTGLDEYMTEREYRNSISQVEKSLDKTCAFIGSGYALEVTRRKINTDTADWRYDNDTFIICCKRNSGNIVVEQGGISGDLNIVDPPTVYNYRISPIRNAMRWFKVWAVGFQNLSQAIFNFTTAKGNYLAKGLNNTGINVIEAAAIAEDDTLTSASFTNVADAKPLWKPEQITFDYPLSLSDYLNLKLNPNGLVKFQTQSKPIEYGYIMEVNYKPNEGLATFTLLKANT